MPFTTEERARMLALKGVGNTVINRLEQIGFSSLAQLQGMEAGAITLQIAQSMNSTCWHNSPQARSAIQAIIDLAQASH